MAQCSSCRTSLPPEARFCLSCGVNVEPVRTGRRSNQAIFLWCIGLLAGLVVLKVPSSVPSGSKLALAENVPPSVQPAAEKVILPIDQTKITAFTWSTDGMIMNANFTIKNDGPKAVKDLKIKCQHSAPSGTVIDSNTRTIYDIVKPHSTRQFRNFNMGFVHSQATASGCRIEDVKVAE